MSLWSVSSLLVSLEKSHTQHLNFFFPVCFALMCTFKPWSFLATKSHCSHLFSIWFSGEESTDLSFSKLLGICFLLVYSIKLILSSRIAILSSFSFKTLSFLLTLIRRCFCSATLRCKSSISDSNFLTCSFFFSI